LACSGCATGPGGTKPARQRPEPAAGLVYPDGGCRNGRGNKTGSTINDHLFHPQHRSWEHESKDLAVDSGHSGRPRASGA
jgi:hypothetical protein